MTSTGHPGYCAADPHLGGALIVAEAYRHLCAVGAEPRAITNNLNFGDVQNPSIMGEVKGCISGMGRAAAILGMPVVSGNVSFYNATKGANVRSIPPTPVIGAVGVVTNADNNPLPIVGYNRLRAGSKLYLIGGDGNWLGSSAYEQLHAPSEHRGRGAPPPIDLEYEYTVGQWVRTRIRAGEITACNDVGKGGCILALARMLMASDIGCALDASLGDLGADWWFGEDQGRYIVGMESAPTDIPHRFIGVAGGDKLGITDTALSSSTLTKSNGVSILVRELRAQSSNVLTPYI